MSEPNVDDLFNEIKDDLQDYARKKSELIKLEIYEKAGKVTAKSVSAVLLFGLFFFVLLFFLVAGALYIGKLTGDNTLGFLCMGTLLLLLALLYVFGLRGRVEYSIMNTVIGELMKNEDEKN